ncbi:hypothetical protein HanIR_Chr07g0305221 [Helianthus annuus]|nr:hypothetical protein HanIR_Chr07g0305221 [Helianthus annuus]
MLLIRMAIRSDDHPNPLNIHQTICIVIRLNDLYHIESHPIEWHENSFDRLTIRSTYVPFDQLMSSERQKSSGSLK